jgi:di/tricarboxylate transporter
LFGSATAWTHLLGILGLVSIFAIGTWRSINLGALSLVATFLIGVFIAGERPAEIYRGFPVDLLVLLVGVTYLFGIAVSNGTIERLVTAAAHQVRHQRAAIPWIVFAVAAVPTMIGALGSAAAALLAPIALRLAERCSLDRRMIGLMVLHGSACGNFSPLNALGVIVLQGTARSGLEMSAPALFFANVAYNVVLGAVIFLWFGGLRLAPRSPETTEQELPPPVSQRLGWDQLCTLAALLIVLLLALTYDLSIGFLAMLAAVTLHLIFPKSSSGAERKIAWDVVLLVCGIVTYVAALQRYGTVEAIGAAIAALDAPLLSALLICVVGAVTSAFASSAGILGVMIALAAPFMIQGEVGVVGFVIALAVSATVVDSSPFSTAGALVVANAAETERQHVYRGLLAWGALMAVTAPLVTWLIFVVLS